MGLTCSLSVGSDWSLTDTDFSPVLKGIASNVDLM